MGEESRPPERKMGKKAPSPPPKREYFLGRMAATPSTEKPEVLMGDIAGD
jgi:hypothetical protein